MKQNITKSKNFEIPINLDIAELNFDALEAMVTGPIVKSKNIPTVWHKIQPSTDLLRIEADFYLGYYKREFVIHVRPNKLIILRDQNSHVKSSDQLSVFELRLLKGLEAQGSLKEFISYFSDQRYPVTKEYPEDFDWSGSRSYFHTVIKPLESIGKIFLPSDITVFQNAIQQTDKSSLKSECIGFCVPTLRRSTGLPLLKPFLGRMTLDQENIRSFITFKSDQIIQLMPDLTENQLSLFKIAERLEEISELQEMEKELWPLWERAIELLKQEKFVYSYNTYHKKQLRGRPQKFDMSRVAFSEETFQPAFHLIESQDRMILKPLMLQQEKWQEVEYSYPEAFPLFFSAKKYDHPIFATSSIRDSKIWIWVTQEKSFTIHNTYSQQFQEDILPELSTLYPFKFKFKTKGELEIHKQKLTIEKKWLQVSQSNETITLTPIIKYLEKEKPVNALTNGTQWVFYEDRKRTIQFRNKKEENAMKRFIQDLHSSFKNQTSKNYVQ